MQQSYTYRTSMAPLQQAQQEGLKAWGRLARFQCAIAGDLLEHNLAGMQAMMSAATPAEYLARQGELNVRFVEKVATHAREFLREAADRSTPGIAPTEFAMSVAEEEITDELASSSAEDETVRVDEDAVEAEHLEQDIHADEPTVEAQPAESSRATPTTARQRRKRPDKSRRGRAHH